MREQDREKDFEVKAREALDRGTENLDPRTLARLRRIRTEALEGEKRGRAEFRPWFPIPLGGLAMASVAILAAILYFNLPGGGPNQAGIEDLDLLASGEGLDFYEDLEFYAWLAEEENESG